MSKRRNEPEEAIDPTLDGLNLPSPVPPLPEPEPEQEEEERDEIIERPVAVICGHGPIVDILGSLVESCGFIVEFVIISGENAPAYATENQIRELWSYDNFVETCQIDHNSFVCVFIDSLEDCVNVVRQCLASDAIYLGLFADAQMKAAVFDALRSQGEPDAELAAIRCPIGLNVGAATPEQLSVGVAAEMLATRNGTMKRLLHDR